MPFTKRPYTKPGRLADVLALIQVLAFDPHAHRSEPGIIERELGHPSSTGGRIVLAKEHPEIFRVSEEGVHPLLLVARHVQPRNQDGKRGPLSREFTNVLIKTAIDLHDRQVDAASWWKHMMPLWTALIAAFVVIASSLLTLRFSHPSASGRFARVAQRFLAHFVLASPFIARSNL
jgi:hypothetical protein